MTVRRRPPREPKEKQDQPPAAKSRAGKAQAGKLQAEDVALWQFAAQSIEPVPKLKPRVPDKGSAQPGETAVEPPPMDQRQAVSAQSPVRADARPPATDTKVNGHAGRPARRASPPPPLAEFDRRKVRKIAAGKLDIEARIDLHGLRQNEAHQKLRGFLMSCASRGLGTVLVITGKGAREADDDAERDWMSDRPDRGVLRRMVPMWLAEPDLRALVISFHGAGPRHGGEGALYIQLRKRSGMRAND